ncbi:hypothetical protein [Enterobacter bugandensis]|uniref:hypothetical protein n=1 Tax=Enterobacter bugandensis TaxID=881260 RepID=UPI002076513E|nr:hypothetical protein [Enterobacter bugandensis]MCM7468122.1 hypothetical protein [Enterobacter bugandensis]
MANPTGKGGFTKGHKRGGRPRKHPFISAIEKLDDSLNNLSDRILDAIAKRDKTILLEIGLPLSQVSRQIELTVKGLLSERIYDESNH